METMVTDDSDVTMDAEMETEDTETVEPSLQKRRNTWPGSLQRPESEDGATGQTAATVEADDDTSPPTSRKPSIRRNAWGNMSYAEMITTAIESGPERRMTLAQIYDWIVKNVPYFQDKGDNSSSASWKNSVRHNLSLHSQFTKLQNEGTSKSSWWVVKPDAAMQRRRARTMESGAFNRRRGKGRMKAPGTNSASSVDDLSQSGSSRCRSNSFASSRGRLSPIQSEVEPGSEWNAGEQVSETTPSQFVISRSKHVVAEAATHFPVSAATTHFPVSAATTHFPVSAATTHFPVSAATSWQNFTMTLNDPVPLVSTPLVAANGSNQTTVLFVEQGVQVSTAKLPEGRGTMSQGPPVIVLLAAAPQTAALPQYLPSTSVVAPPATQPPLSNISCVTFGRLEAISDAKITQKILPKVSVSSAVVAPAKKDPVVVKVDAPCPAPPPRVSSVSESYLQVLRFLTSRNVRAYMKSRPDFKEKLCRFLLAKKEKMLQEMNDRDPQPPQRILPELTPEGLNHRRVVGIPREISRVVEKPGVSTTDNRGGRGQLEEILNSISLTCETSGNQSLTQSSSTMQDVVRARHSQSSLEEILNSITLTGKPVGAPTFPQASATTTTLPSRSTPSNDVNALPLPLGGLEMDVDQDIALEPDFLFDFNFDNLNVDLNCDDDFLNQF